MAVSIVETNIPAVTAAITAGVASATLEGEMALGRTALAAKEILLQFLVAATPKKTHELADSSTGDVLIEGEGAVVAVGQTKTVFWRKRGGQYPLPSLLIGGHGEYDITPLGKAKGGADALFWPGAQHPVKRVHMPAKAGIDYPLQAVANALPALDVLMARELGGAAESIVAVMRGGSA